MYLLMLLATFLAAIQGYSLSARPDYDRDVVRKKNAAIVFKFNNHHNTVHRFISEQQENTTSVLIGFLPEDIFYAHDDVLYMRQRGGEINVFNFRETVGSDDPVDPQNRYRAEKGSDILSLGRHLYDKSEMVSKLICTRTTAGNFDEAVQCEPTMNADGTGIEASCCPSSNKYLVSYRKADPRILNRATGKVGYDFMASLKKRDARENVGIITKKSEGGWYFEGKSRAPFIYAKDLQAFFADGAHAGEVFPEELKQRSEWNLPRSIFTDSFFTNADRSDTHFCDDGCLFRIEAVL